ncbi:MAG: sulfate reduction electron transfer complex DsrMKJOP subunit DsrM [Candidatus Magnetomorum sp.]|nr:sulfate reduction electron transfer complex DsrMKJOP subunit DsrM [Candidatus Magnetomorum sp.]
MNVNYLFSLLVVVALFLFAWVGAGVWEMKYLFGVFIPYAAFITFAIGVIYRIVNWAQSPVPFRIPTTCGQAESLPWIKQNKIDNPSTLWGVIVRMLLEVLFFRSLFRNIKLEFNAGKRIAYEWEKWLWLAALAFHWSFLAVLVRHLRFFTEPVPFAIQMLEEMDSILQVGLPVIFLSGFALLAAATYLFVRRVVIPQVRYISLPADYFPLFLIMAIAATGMFMRYLTKVDIIRIKELTMGLVSLHPAIPDGVGTLFFVHLFLVCVLFAYFPFSKLMHSGGVLMSPTRNLANNNRAKRHVNPWNYPVKVHTYEEYENEFRDRMIEAGLPVDKKE